jgi:hypothetical protein
MRSRRKKERPDKLPLHIVRDGRHVIHHLPIEDYPTILGMLSFDKPRFLSGKPPQEDKGGLVAPGLYGLNIDVKSYVSEYTKKHGGSGLSFGPIQPGLYARMLAKIAHTLSPILNLCSATEAACVVSAPLALALRNVRGDRGKVGIIRSPVRATILPDRPK